MPGNIRVFCRCRPLNKAEVSAGCSMVVDFDVAKDGELGVINGGSTKKTFKFDRVYTPKDDQGVTYIQHHLCVCKHLKTTMVFLLTRSGEDCVL